MNAKTTVSMVYNIKRLFYALFLIILNNSFINIFGSEIPQKVLICGVAKNVAKDFYRNQKEIKNIASLFQDYRVIVYENNSTDDTKKLFSDWSEQDEKVIFLSEDLTDDFIRNYTPLQGNCRTQFIARARNIVLKKAFYKEFSAFDYLIMLDLDDFYELNLKELKKVILKPEKNWDAVFANGSYDLYALKSPEFPHGPELLSWRFYGENLKTIGENLAASLKKNKWLKVDSAFGGFAIYKKNAIKNCLYDGRVTLELLCLLMNYQNKKDPLYDLYKSTISYNLMTLFSILKNKYSSIPQDFDFYTCEHINFHLNMKKNGFNNLYINADLKRPSKSHTNY